jgi:hypothetical protein
MSSVRYCLRALACHRVGTAIALQHQCCIACRSSSACRLNAPLSGEGPRRLGDWDAGAQPKHRYFNLVFAAGIGLASLSSDRLHWLDCHRGFFRLWSETCLTKLVHLPGPQSNNIAWKEYPPQLPRKRGREVGGCGFPRPRPRQCPLSGPRRPNAAGYPVPF